MSISLHVIYKIHQGPFAPAVRKLRLSFDKGTLLLTTYTLINVSALHYLTYQKYNYV